jgi:hypothetical protein
MRLQRVQAVLNEVLDHLGLADFLEVTEKATPSHAYQQGSKSVGVRRGRYAEKHAEWPAPKVWTAQLGAQDCLQVVYTQRWQDDAVATLRATGLAPASRSAGVPPMQNGVHAGHGASDHAANSCNVTSSGPAAAQQSSARDADRQPTAGVPGASGSVDEEKTDGQSAVVDAAIAHHDCATCSEGCSHEAEQSSTHAPCQGGDDFVSVADMVGRDEVDAKGKAGDGECRLM